MLDINCASDASFVIQNAVRSHASTWERIDNIEDYLLRCAQPFDDAELKEQGYDWSANFNYQKGRSKIEQVVLDNAADINNALGFIEIEFRRFDKNKDKKKIFGFLQDDFLKEKLADVISGAFVDSLEKDTAFYLWLCKAEYNVFTFGYCPITRDIFGYLGNANHVRSVAFEDRTKLTNITSWILFGDLKADFLYKQLKSLGSFKFESKNFSYYDEKEKTLTEGVYDISENGWIKQGLVEVFEKAAGASKVFEQNKEGEKEVKPQFNTWEDVEGFVQRFGLPFVMNNVNNLFLAKIYYFDEDNNFVEVYVAINSDPLNKGFGNNIGMVGSNKHLLYKKNHGNRIPEDVINVIRDYTLNSNDYIHELRGSGKLIAEDSLRFDLKKCRLEDKLTIAGSPIIETTSAFQGENIKVAVVGGFLAPEEGVKISASETKFDLVPHVTSLGLDEQHFKRESEHLDPSIQDRLTSRPTKDEVQTKSREVSVQKLNRTPIKFNDYSIVFNNAIKSLTAGSDFTGSNKNIRDYFFDKIKEGIPDYEITDEEIKEVVSCIIRTKLSPVLGNIGAIKEAMAITGSSKSRARLLRQYLIALGFSRQDARIYVEVEDYGNQVTIAALENVAFYTSSEIAFALDQDHITHINTHFAKCDRVIQGVSGGEDIVQAFHFLTNCLSNTEKHLSAIQNSVFFKSRFNDMNKVQIFLTKKTTQIAGIIQQMKQQQAQQAAQQKQGQQGQPQVDPKVQAGIYNDRIKMMDKIKRTELLTQTSMKNKAMMFQQQLDNNKRQTDASIEVSKELAEIKKNIELIKASTSMAGKQQSNIQPIDQNAGQTTTIAA